MTTLHTHEGDTAVQQQKPGKAFVVKRCPECFTNLPISTTVCPWCSQKVKIQTNKHGYAKKPINWRAYLTCFVSWVGLGFYIWWVFFK